MRASETPAFSLTRYLSLETATIDPLTRSLAPAQFRRRRGSCLVRLLTTRASSPRQPSEDRLFTLAASDRANTGQSDQKWYRSCDFDGSPVFSRLLCGAREC